MSIHPAWLMGEGDTIGKGLAHSLVFSGQFWGVQGLGWPSIALRPVPCHEGMLLLCLQAARLGERSGMVAVRVICLHLPAM